MSPSIELSLCNAKTNVSTSIMQVRERPSLFRHHSGAEFEFNDPETSTLVDESTNSSLLVSYHLDGLKTRPINHDQLVVEVKGIYAGLVMVEAKCIEVDEKQTMLAQDKDLLKKQPLTNDQWRSLIALHKQLLHEHHDFFLASQHPSASFNLSRLTAKHSMPARMWRHGIHAFLEVLRHRLPESLDHMLAFIYIAYSMMALPYETVSTFEDTWIECLGDLSRYRMAIEDNGPRDREVWSNVAKYWYNKPSDNFRMDRLYHHFAILARPYTSEQLSLYCRSLICVTPFESARGSILTLLNPVTGTISQCPKSIDMEILVIKAHGILFVYHHRPLEDLKDVPKGGTTDAHFNERKNRPIQRRKPSTVFTVSNSTTLFEFGALPCTGEYRHPLQRALEDMKTKLEEKMIEPALPSFSSSPTYVTTVESFWSSIGRSFRSESMQKVYTSLAKWKLIKRIFHKDLYARTDTCLSNVQQARKPVDEQSFASMCSHTSTSLVGPSTGIATWWRIPYQFMMYGLLFSSRVLHFHSVQLRSLSQRGLQRCGHNMRSLNLAMVLRVFLMLKSWRIASAMPTGTPRPDNSAIVYEDFLTSLLYLLLASVVMGFAHFIARSKGPMTVYGTLMAVTSLGWWAIRGGDNTTAGAQWT